MIRTCLFDMGNVLIHFSHEKMCRQIGALCGKTAAEIRALLLDSGVLADFERGRMTEPEVHAWLESKVGASVPLPHLVDAVCEIFHLNAPMAPLIDSLRARGVRLVLLSNVSVTHFRHCRSNFDVLDRFDDFVLSYKAGAVKPERRIFETALEKIGCAPGDCFYTDDIPEYVAAGRSHGLDAEVFTDAAALRGHLTRRGIEIDA